MTKQNEQTAMERALTRAAKDGVKIVMDFGDHWRVRGSDGVTLYEVRLTEGTEEQEMTCTCRTKAGVLCKHVAVCVQHLRQELEAREQALLESLADMAVATLAPYIDAWLAQVARRAEMQRRNDAAMAQTEEALAAREQVLVEMHQTAKAAYVMRYAPVAWLAAFIVKGAALGHEWAWAEAKERAEMYR